MLYVCICCKIIKNIQNNTLLVLVIIILLTELIQIRLKFVFLEGCRENYLFYIYNSLGTENKENAKRPTK